jgi:hypothetical protein
MNLTFSRDRQTLMRALVLSLAAPLAACASSVTGSTPNEESNGIGEPAGAGPSYSDLVVFTTKAVFDGDLGGLAGADAKCNTYAKAAGLSGTFRAWLSDSGTDAISRVPEGGPWRILDSDGRQSDVAFESKDAWTGYPKVSIVNTEFGKTLSELSSSTTTEIPYTWTGTELGGKQKGCHCLDWTSSKNYNSDCPSGEYGGVIGSRHAREGDEGWTDLASNPCDARSALLCYQLPD